MSQQLVVKGHLLAMVPVERTQVGGCGLGIRGPYASWDIEVAVDSVLFGVAEDSILTVTTVHRGMYPSGVFVPGREVIVWGFHNCVDGWRLYGDAYAIDSNSDIIASSTSLARNMLTTPTGEIRPTGPLLMQRMGALAQAHCSRSLAGGEGVAAARVGAATPTAAGLVVTIDSTKTVYGSGTSGVTGITFAWTNGCFYDVSPGDWLLLPIGGAVGSGAVTLNACPYTYLVKSDYARALGVPMDQLEYALQLEGNGVIVQLFLGE